jgi:hypothetical protein
MGQSLVPLEASSYPLEAPLLTGTNRNSWVGHLL